MSSSNMKVFFRSLVRNKLYSLITVFGFALSLTFVILLGVYIQQELSVDQFHKNKDRIFRAVNENRSSFGTLIGGELQNKYPEIECYTRFFENSTIVENLQKEKMVFDFLLVDSTFFKMFSFRLLEGNPEDVLKIRNSVVLTRSYARKLFGAEPALGKEIDCNRNDLKLVVTGIMEDMPENTHFNKCDGLVQFPMLADFWSYPDLLTNNDNSSFGLYVMAKEGVDLPAKTPLVLKDLKENYWMFQRGYAKEFSFEPLTKVYFGGKDGQGMHGNSMSLVVVLSAIALVILLLALINYNNLSVAQAGFRAKEAAVKKLLGTDNGALFRQFILESETLCFISFILAFGGSLLFEPVFNHLLNTQVSVMAHLNAGTIGVVILAVALLGLVAGLAPAFLITRFNPVDVVKGAFRKKTKGVYSKALICFQYTVAITLIVCTIVIWKQTDFMRNYNLGFNKENIISMGNQVSAEQKMALRSEFDKIPGVVGVSFVCGSPVDGGNNMSFSYKDKALSFQEFRVDSAFFGLMGIEVMKNNVADSKNGIWLNEAAVKALELPDQPLECNPYGGSSIPVYGVVKNFHFRDLTKEVGPAWLRPLGDGDGAWSILVKINATNPGKTFREVKAAYQEFIGGMPVDAQFIDQSIHQWYESNERTARLIGYFSALAIILSMMGILAMATYFIQQRIKEIGIRRVNGATIEEVLRMLVSSFMKWIVLAFVIACPIAWYAMTSWLNGFAYRTDLSWWVFGLAGAFAGCIALLVVGWESVKASTTNPVKSLKIE